MRTLYIGHKKPYHTLFTLVLNGCRSFFIQAIHVMLMPSFLAVPFFPLLNVYALLVRYKIDVISNNAH